MAFEVTLEGLSEKKSCVFYGAFKIVTGVASGGGPTFDLKSDIFSIDLTGIKCKKKFFLSCLFSDCCTPDDEAMPDINNTPGKFDHDFRNTISILGANINIPQGHYMYWSYVELTETISGDNYIDYKFRCNVWKTHVKNPVPPYITTSPNTVTGPAGMKVKIPEFLIKVYPPDYRSDFTLRVSCKEMKEENVKTGHHGDVPVVVEESEKGCGKQCSVVSPPK